MIDSIVEWFTGAATGIAEGVSNAAATVVSYLIYGAFSVLATFITLIPA